MDDGSERKYIDYSHKPIEQVDAAGPAALNDGSYQAIPFRTAAADWTKLPLNSILLIEASKDWGWNWPNPDQKGIVEIHDRGSGVAPNQIDIYVGEQYVRGDKRNDNLVNVHMMSDVYIWEG